VAQELKTTLNLPKTDFPMKANLPQNEPKMLARWKEMRLYDRIRQARSGAPKYVLHDGPPYANGPLHLGTALNKSLKDFVVKSKTMAGFDSPYVPGWDCHGLPIELKVDTTLGKKRLGMSPLEIRRECRKYAEKFVDLQREQFKRIAVFGRWEDPYLTMSPQYESVVLSTLYTFIENGFVYKGLRPVYWCIHDQTALAEAEVEYQNHTSPSIWVRYRLQSDPRDISPELADKRILEGKTVYAIIWTTTPWTLPASMAIAFHPHEQYVAIENGEAVYIVAEKLATVTVEKCGFQNWKIISRFPGKKLEHLYFYHPFLPWPERKILGVLADYVTMETGTGAVHTAPYHGADDFYTGVKYKLEQACNVDAGGHIRKGLPEYDGKTVFQANQPIIELLKSRGALLNVEKLEHSYPHCWRCHNPVIFRATEQWFIAMDGKLPGGGTLRSQALEEIKKVHWDPAWGEERIANMVSGRPDWCISRQRIWGVPIAVFLCEGCNAPLRSKEVEQATVALVAREGVDAWYTDGTDKLLPPGTKCGKCGGSQFKKETDIIDVWFESGSSQAAVLEHEPGLTWPCDLYLEGGDQYRGWFQSSLLCAVGVHGKAPYRSAATAGWTLDPEGRAMHKSLGNAVDPIEIADKLGGEIIRLWVASVDFREDTRSSDELMQRVAENYRKLRNTFRYILGNLNGFDPAKHAVPYAQMEALDRYMMRSTAEVAEQVTRWYEGFQFHKIYQRINQFAVVELSAFYFDVLKDRLYTYAPNSHARRSAQTAIWRIGEVLVRLLAPILSFTSDEVWPFLPTVSGRAESVHLVTFPTPAEILGPLPPDENWEQLRSDWTLLQGVREEVLKALEQARNQKLIGSGLEAQVSLTAPEPANSVLKRYAGELRYLFIVSSVLLEASPSGNGVGGVFVKVSKAPGKKCERCWNYSTHVGEDHNYPSVCERCSAVLKEINS